MTAGDRLGNDCPDRPRDAHADRLMNIHVHCAGLAMNIYTYMNRTRDAHADRPREAHADRLRVMCRTIWPRGALIGRLMWSYYIQYAATFFIP